MTISQRDRAYNYIRTRLLNGKLPPGTRLSHRAMAKEIGISFIPVREALSQLVSEGLVAHEPKLGSFVRQVSREELAELYDLRVALESHAVMAASKLITEDELNLMQEKNEMLTGIADEVTRLGRTAWTGERIDRWMLSDAEFHLVLLRAAGNRRALKIVSELRLMTHVFGHHDAGRSIEDLQRICEEHRRLLDALRKGNADAAREVLVAHLRQGCERALKAYDRRRLHEDTQQQVGLTYPDALRERIHAIELDAAPAEPRRARPASRSGKGKTRAPRRR